MAYQKIADDLRISSARTTLISALDNARAIAIKRNRYVVAAFRPQLTADGTSQIIEIVVAVWNRDSANAENGEGNIWTYDRFIPVQGISIAKLPEGMNVASPGYSTGDDSIWKTTSYLPAITNPVTEYYGNVTAILFSPSGHVVVRNAESGADRSWVDFNNDGDQKVNDELFVDWPWPVEMPGFDAYMELQVQDGEPMLSFTSVLVIFDEKECRQLYDVTVWDEQQRRDDDYTSYIRENGTRVQFNPFSGVVSKEPLR